MKLGYRPDEAAEVLGSVQLLDECISAGWIKPVVRRHRLTIYNYADIAKCWERIIRTGPPPPLKQKKAKTQK